MGLIFWVKIMKYREVDRLFIGIGGMSLVSRQPATYRESFYWDGYANIWFAVHYILASN
jgi:hypothetical protein